MVAEILEIEFDVDFPRETFVFEAPAGEPVRSLAPARMRVVSLDQAAREAGFTVLAPARVPAGLRAEVTVVEAGWPHERPSVLISFRSEDAGHALEISQAPRAAGTGRPGSLEPIAREGQEMAVREIPGLSQLWMEREGVEVMVSGEGFDVEALIEVALSLRPAPTEPPPLVDA